MADIVLEVCVDSLAGLAAAVRGGADRIELCAALGVGGLTPSAGMMQAAAGVPVPVYAMIRPRSGDFVYSDAELLSMRVDIDLARDMGMAGVVFGASLVDGRLDLAAMERLVSWSDGMGKVLHRAFDLTGGSFPQALESAIDLGIERILTSGGAPNVTEGLTRLAECYELANGRITIMPGAGVEIETVGALMSRLPLREVHGSCSEPMEGLLRDVARLGLAGHLPRATSAVKVRALKARLAAG